MGGGEGQGYLACYSPWGHNELDPTEQMNNKTATIDIYKVKYFIPMCFIQFLRKLFPYTCLYVYVCICIYVCVCLSI